MEYVEFGSTGQKVSRIGFGGAPAGLKDYVESYNPEEKEAKINIIRAVEKAIELGITYFDTAPAYGNGKSEELMGEALSGVKDSIFLATKVSPGSASQVRKSVEKSLKRLKRENIDLLQIHGSSYSSRDLELIESEMLGEMSKLKEEGLVRFIGFTSEDNNDIFYKLIQSKKFDMLQLCYNFIFQHPYEPSRPFGSLYEAEKMEMGTVAMRTLTSGTFQKWIEMVNPDNKFDYSRALIQFVLSNPLVDVALIGMRTPEQVIQNVEICEAKDERIDLDRLHQRYV